MADVRPSFSHPVVLVATGILRREDEKFVIDPNDTAVLAYALRQHEDDVLLPEAILALYQLALALHTLHESTRAAETIIATIVETIPNPTRFALSLSPSMAEKIADVSGARRTVKRGPKIDDPAPVGTTKVKAYLDTTSPRRLRR